MPSFKAIRYFVFEGEMVKTTTLKVKKQNSMPFMRYQKAGATMKSANCQNLDTSEGCAVLAFQFCNGERAGDLNDAHGGNFANSALWRINGRFSLYLSEKAAWSGVILNPAEVEPEP